MTRDNALLIATGALILALTGCTALTTTTDHGIDAATALGHNLATSSRASSEQLVTEPDTPRYASARVFVTSQLPLLRREAAAGGGENIDALARLLNTDGDALGYWMQTHYASLFERESEPETIVQRVAANRS